MIIDPWIARIRFPLEAGPDFYEGVMRRIAAHDDHPSGMLMHFTATRDGEFNAWSVFRDRDAMLEAFLAYSSRDAQAEMLARGLAFDITRDEFPLLRIFIEPGVDVSRLAFKPVGEIAATSSDVVTVDVERYYQLTDAIGLFDEPVAGRLAHVAFSDRSGKVDSFDFWESRRTGQDWYDANANAVFERLNPGELTPEVNAASWIDLHSFVVTATGGDAGRHYVRRDIDA